MTQKFAVARDGLTRLCCDQCDGRIAELRKKTKGFYVVLQKSLELQNFYIIVCLILLIHVRDSKSAVATLL